MLIHKMGAYKTLNGIHIIYNNISNCVESSVYCTIHLFTYQFIVKQFVFGRFCYFSYFLNSYVMPKTWSNV
jgi:hypothetical protein